MTMLMVTNVQRFGVHHQPTLITLTFNTPLNPISATNVAQYALFGPIGSKHPKLIPIKSASYDPATQTVTLHPSQPLNVHLTYELIVAGLVNTTGAVLKGNDGVPGDAYVANVNRSTLSGFYDHFQNFVPIDHGKLYPAAYNAAYNGGDFATFKGTLGSFATVDRVSYEAATANAVAPQVAKTHARVAFTVGRAPASHRHA
jgi:hypothetical protein